MGDQLQPTTFTEPPGSEGNGSGEPVWLTPGVRGIGAASLLVDLGHEVPTALLPSFLTSTFGAPAAALGLIEGVSDGLAGRGAPRRRRARRRPAPAASHGGGRLHGDRGSLRADGGGLERVAGGRPLAIVAHAACAQAGPRGVLPERLTAAAR